jgi:hypothetical protein
MPSARRQKTKAKPAARRPAPPRRVAPKKAAGTKSGSPKPTPKPSAATAKVALAPPPVVRRADGRVHVLSLSFVRDGDEFLARMETDAGQITELKNRALDQLLTLVASELEDLLE